MSKQTLGTITLETLENYRSAATQAVAAYRLGSRRVVAAVNGALETRVYPRTARLAPRTTERLDEVRGTVSGMVVKGIDGLAERTSQVIELGSTAAVAQIEKVGDYAASVGNETVLNSLQAAARLSLPGARLALALSGRLARGAEALVEAVAPTPAARRTLGRAARKAAAAPRKASKAGKVKAAAKAAKAAPRQRAARSASMVPTPKPRTARGARGAKPLAAEAGAA